MSTDSTQETIIGEPSGEYVEIETNGRVIRPLLQLPDALVDEVRLQIHQDGMQIAALDPANVALVILNIWPRAFDEFDTNADGDFFIGLSLDSLQSALQDARMGKRTADDVSIRLDGSLSHVEILREYDETTVNRTDEFLNIDPDAVRDAPDMPDVDMDYRAEVDIDALKDSIDHIGSMHDHIELAEQSGDMTLTGGMKDSDDPVEASRATFLDVVDSVGDAGFDGSESRYSIDYISDMATAAKKGKVDEVEPFWAAERPAELHFKRTGEDGVLYDGRYMVAPRIQS